jgi:glycerol-3-phosphate dehydrogenase
LDKKYSNSLVRTAVSSLSTASTRKKHTKGGGVIRTIEGNVLVGPDALETINREDFSTHSANITDIFERQKRTVPALSEHQIINYFSGVRASTYEEDFVVCKGKYVANMVHAAGIQSPGLTAAPAIAVDVARMVFELLGGGKTVEMNPDFDPVRVPPPRLSKMDAAARAELIDRNSDYGIIICRCEEVSKGEILNALRRNVPCDTIDGVKRRVRPGMGRCQGGFCEPHILEIISKEKSMYIHNVKKFGSKTEVLFGCTKVLSEKKIQPVKTARVDRETEELLNKRAKQMLALSVTNRKDGSDDGQ